MAKSSRHSLRVETARLKLRVLAGIIDTVAGFSAKSTILPQRLSLPFLALWSLWPRPPKISRALAENFVNVQLSNNSSVSVSVV